MNDMPDDVAAPRPQQYATRLSHAGRAGKRVRGFVNPPLLRGSTVLIPSVAERTQSPRPALDQVSRYGTDGSATHFALEDVIAEIEGGTRCQIVSTGLAAITLPLLAFLKAGDHLLMPDSCYGPARSFCDGLLRGYGIVTDYYDPTIDEAGIAALFRPDTRILYTESPGSHTFEVQDVPMLAAVAHARGARVMMDNTWGIHAFQPFRHGVDISIQALTKYVGGHSDILLGGVTVATQEDWAILRTAAKQLGQYASPDDCWLALRGVRTLAVRMERQARSALEVASWLQARPEVLRVLYPPLPGAPGHELWKRDFDGAASLFGVVFRPQYTQASLHAMIDALDLFGIGASWGGYESLIVPTSGTLTRVASPADLGGPAARIHIGLEDPADLIADLDRGMALLATG
jgi:cystathionine beta-lyase